ncbi:MULTISPECIES: DUF6587 family protein [unclassified Acinetobacter]|uniref:DUF6587 family protein n=1 Tax=unclassified Acinetobacter TaxID=196816 RepID=UPI002935134D|nr:MULTISPECIES: DUF6587 family protein [unclassified Acinetobacter]WOE30662.1 hypothetical protein QSG84_09775 [Acinetobacter sp. SAAs470]WOE38854.1 hypothetical protein QSG86_03440 [Acinetobacter sp. SAAs474]
MIEIVVVALLVIWSAVVVFKKVFPRTSNSVFTTLANYCEQKGWLKLAKWLKPALASGCGGHCGCAASDEQANKKVEVQAVKWK